MKLIFYQQITAIDCVYTLADEHGTKQSFTSTIKDFQRRIKDEKYLRNTI